MHGPTVNIFRRTTMTITFISHSAFLVELPRCALLFDWTGEQPLPPHDRSKPLYVFASHHHGDHYTPKIFSLGMDNVTYILATCIRLSARRKAGLGIDDRRVHRMAAGQSQTIGEVQVTTLRSNDAGVAWVVRVGETTFFHAGDLNDWWWEGEAPEWNERIRAGFLKSLHQLENVSADVAFLPLDGRLEENFHLGFHQFMETLQVKYAFPMHCWGDFSVIRRLKALPESRAYRAQVMDIFAEGQQWNL